MIIDEWELYDGVTKEEFLEWLRHPVTRIGVLVVAAYLARNLVLTHGARLLGLTGDAPGDV